MDHYAYVVFSEPGRCWRFIHNPDGTGRPTLCPKPVVWTGTDTLKGGRRIPVWSCEGHREGVEEAEAKPYRSHPQGDDAQGEQAAERNKRHPMILQAHASERSRPGSSTRPQCSWFSDVVPFGQGLILRDIGPAPEGPNGGTR
jgi:hypothetical protein